MFVNLFVLGRKLGKEKLKNVLLRGGAPAGGAEDYADRYAREWQRYLEWRESQPCQDCGVTKKNCAHWVTETQCSECFKLLGPPEKRGLPSSKDLADKAGVNI